MPGKSAAFDPGRALNFGAACVLGALTKNSLLADRYDWQCVYPSDKGLDLSEITVRHFLGDGCSTSQVQARHIAVRRRQTHAPVARSKAAFNSSGASSGAPRGGRCFRLHHRWSTTERTGPPSQGREYQYSAHHLIRTDDSHPLRFHSSSVQRYCRSAAGARGSEATDAPVRPQRLVGRLVASHSGCERHSRAERCRTGSTPSRRRAREGQSMVRPNLGSRHQMVREVWERRRSTARPRYRPPRSMRKRLGRQTHRP